VHILRSSNRGTTYSPPIFKCRSLGRCEHIVLSEVHELIIHGKPDLYKPWIIKIVVQHQLNAHCAVEVASGWDVYVLECILPHVIGI